MYKVTRELAVAVMMMGTVIVGLTGCGPTAANGKIAVVAAESQYGGMAKDLGGNEVAVTSLLKNPNTDPHEFEASASSAEAVAAAGLIIENGIGYDSWLDKLVGASPDSGRIVFNVGKYLGRLPGDNPHIWYASWGWPREARAITRDLIHLRPSQATYFRHREAVWLTSLRPVYRAIRATRRIMRGSKVIATEPVFGYMLKALGAKSMDSAFQKATMEGIDPPPSSVAAFESTLKARSVRMLFYNSQVVDPTTVRMRQLAEASAIPIVGVTETQPANVSFVQWQLGQLRQIRRKWK